MFKRQLDRNSLSGIVDFLALCMLNLVFLMIQFISYVHISGCRYVGEEGRSTGKFDLNVGSGD